MYVARPTSRSERLICPKCGTLQESPGSTVCEECGADLSRPEEQAPAPPPPASRQPSRQPGHVVTTSLRTLVAVPVRLVRSVIAALQAFVELIIRIVSFTLRTAAVLLVLGSLVIGLSYLPAVRARVPIAKELPGMTRDLLQRGVDAGDRLLRSLRGTGEPRLEAPRPAAPHTERPSQPAATKPPTTRPAAAKPAAARPSLTVKSTPQGATILLNQRRVGKTPLTVTVAPGTYKVTLSRSGYKSVTRTITVKAGAPASLNVTLTIAP